MLVARRLRVEVRGQARRLGHIVFVLAPREERLAAGRLARLVGHGGQQRLPSWACGFNDPGGVGSRRCDACLLKGSAAGLAPWYVCRGVYGAPPIGRALLASAGLERGALVWAARAQGRKRAPLAGRVGGGARVLYVLGRVGDEVLLSAWAHLRMA